jgi:hypothetical protein
MSTRSGTGQSEIASFSTPAVHPLIRWLAIVFLFGEGVAVVVWWLWLLTFPVAREPFLATGAPDSTLLAFLPADVLLYSCGAFASAYLLLRGSKAAWPVLCFHAGTGCYAALYALALPLLGGGAFTGAVLMFPALVVLPLLVWLFRPEAFR